MIKTMHMLLLPILAMGVIVPTEIAAQTSQNDTYALDEQAIGITETINNIVNVTVVSKDASDFKAEYRAGFVQGKLQAKGILAARDNNWNLSYLLDPAHAFPRHRNPTSADLDRAGGVLKGNFNAFVQYLKNPNTDAEVSYRLKRLLFRMVGIYHGAARDKPALLDFSGNWLPDVQYFKADELKLGYETPTLSFMDLYYINGFADFGDVIANTGEHKEASAKDAAQSSTKMASSHPEKCSAFLKRTSDGQVILTHNTWSGFLSQTQSITLSVNNDRMTVNAATPGLIASGTDFGYNNKGIMFNETTHRMSRTKVKPNGLWIFWRAALAEQFSSSIDDFFRYISLDNSGTYLNGYMLTDAKNNETGLVEMSYRCFVYYRSTGGAYSVTSKSLDGKPCSTEYDKEMVTPSYLMGINFPASFQVRTDLQSTDNRPARRRQFKKFLPGVDNIASAKKVISYTDPANPLSINGRWDLDYGETDYPQMIPDGTIDEKVANTAMVRSFMGLSGTLDRQSKNTGFWMRYGTAIVNGDPYIWSQSSWKWQKRREVPDRLDGKFVLLPLHLK
ncbi:MAG: hypothetical protein P8Y67_12975 [Alphaproteobacteria bacterium]